MHLKAKPPIFVPRPYWAELEKLSKAALMDLVWDFASTTAAAEAWGAQRADAADAPTEKVIMETLRERAEVILIHRKAA